VPAHRRKAQHQLITHRRFIPAGAGNPFVGPVVREGDSTVNARLGIEIYFATPQNFEASKPMIEEVMGKDMDDDLNEQARHDAEAKFQDIYRALADRNDVAAANVIEYDTVVIGEENYDDYIDRTVGSEIAASGRMFKKCVAWISLLDFSWMSRPHQNQHRLM